MASSTQELLGKLEKRGKAFWVVAGGLVVGLIGASDIATGSEIAFSLFYLIPIALGAWYAGRTPALVTSIACTAASFVADVASGQQYSLPIIRYWNAMVRMGVFVVVSLLLPTLRALERERAIARIDDLTGAANRRHLFEATQAELNRSQRYRHPFAIAFIDLDRFKTINDRFGHRAGDDLLVAVVSRAKSQLRKTDLMGRLGGDEFMLLLPETDQDAAKVTVAKIQAALQDEMNRNSWPVTFSIGVVTYRDGEVTPSELIRRADDLMYSVKAQGGNAAAYDVCDDAADAA